MYLTEMTSQERIEINKLPIIIGGDSAADIPLDDPTLPPLQCMIDDGNGGGAILWNLREDFPLYVNGNHVTKAKLSHGDVLLIGQRRFVFSCEEKMVIPQV
jgi:hypothetical protein